MSIDPRIDPSMPHTDIVQRVADIIREIRFTQAAALIGVKP